MHCTSGLQFEVTFHKTPLEDIQSVYKSLLKLASLVEHKMVLSDKQRLLWKFFYNNKNRLCVGEVFFAEIRFLAPGFQLQANADIVEVPIPISSVTNIHVFETHVEYKGRSARTFEEAAEEITQQLSTVMV